MKCVIQRVKYARVRVNGNIVGSIEKGMLIFLGIDKKDEERDVYMMAEKIRNLRIFNDENLQMNLSLKDINGEILVVSQFTLLGDCRRGRRPSFSDSADPEKAKDLYNKFINYLIEKGEKVATGIFQTYMEVELINDGPVTLIIDSEDLKRPRREK
ncbi:MAG: D-aminoacyl-tRNA deacylase [Dictyoglomus sp.]|nr:D-aminoacyl-tRNA deacylase [Dictyoglomus sp.]MCX7942721.1 D-aminoacyl-tRNA deacylase [Dictyoglomaceae bacterium]MDW8189265.1 D-aminoacyl-tRNA deacylase [Dictyoglomus sp.]